ncbi:hypothetical protein DNTS_026829 [Danionella cerebrum]|uniref:Uncharacterized protein n=1 Tax=Danionella cerebrum TaxID=2873325 RepID=A0A553N4Q1_9TELE|nr:hypothetical protein DNTS_026829 [Danionella translucida]
MLSSAHTANMAAIRRNKSSLMTAAVSCSRLRQVQALLREDVGAAPDGILCSLGIDSRYNEGCSELASFLFCGLYRQNLLDMELPEDFPEEVLDDVIILIKAEYVHLYCNPVNYGYLLPYYEDEEVAEEFKISSFVSMVQDCQCIGIPYSSHGHVQKFDMFQLEKWPIIQAFALEGIGAGVFFTMKYKLTDVSQRLWKIYSRLDPVSLDWLLKEDLQLFQKQWSCLFSSIDIESALSLQELSEAQVAEPFRTYYSHGLISSNITDKSKSRQPFVLFGCHSTKEDQESYCFTFPSECHQLRNTGLGGGFAKHMLLQCVAPKGPLACTRTYFLGSTHVPYLGIKCFSINSSASKAKDVADQTFQLALDNFGLMQYKGALRSRAMFSIQAVNREGLIIPLCDEDSRFLVKTASMIVSDIPDLQCGVNLGSVAFSESFLESSVYVQQRDGALSSDSSFTVLTSSVPRYVCWLVDEAEVKQSEQAQHLLKAEDGTCLGFPVQRETPATCFQTACCLHPRKLVFFSEGILFVHPRHGSITLPMSHINTMKLYEGTALLPHLPFTLHSTDLCLAIALLPKTKVYKSFYSQVLPAWRKAESGPRVQYVLSDQLTPEHKSLYCRLLKMHEMNAAVTNSQKAVLKTAYPQLPEQDRFLQHFAFSSSVGEESVCSDHFSTVFSDKESESSPLQSNMKVVLTIIAGLPGSHKENLCDFLMEMNQNSSRWEVFCPSQEGSEEFSASHLQRFLSNLLAKQMETELNASRVVLLIPGYTDILDVIQAITAHPDPQVPSQVLLFPKLLEQCSQGIVSNVVFTGLTIEQKHPLLKYTQQLIRAANASTAFILAEKGAVRRTEDIRLLLNDSSFSQSHMINARYLLYPGWWEGRFVSGSGSLALSQHRIEFSRPLEKALFLQRCKALKSSLKPSPFTGNIYHISGRVLFSACRSRKDVCVYLTACGVCFTVDNDRQMAVKCNSISGNVIIAPEQGTHHGSWTTNNCYLMFHGVGLTQEGLKDWLRHCAKQKAMKKIKKNRRTLTPEEIKCIHVKRHLDPLPPGYFYNGHNFVSFFGDKQNIHPLMDRFIDEYVQEANKEIELFNREVDLQPQIGSGAESDQTEGSFPAVCIWKGRCTTPVLTQPLSIYRLHVVRIRAEDLSFRTSPFSQRMQVLSQDRPVARNSERTLQRARSEPNRLEKRVGDRLRVYFSNAVKSIQLEPDASIPQMKLREIFGSRFRVLAGNRGIPEQSQAPVLVKGYDDLFMQLLRLRAEPPLALHCCIRGADVRGTKQSLTPSISPWRWYPPFEHIAAIVPHRPVGRAHGFISGASCDLPCSLFPPVAPYIDSNTENSLPTVTRFSFSVQRKQPHKQVITPTVAHQDRASRRQFMVKVISVPFDHCQSSFLGSDVKGHENMHVIAVFHDRSELELCGIPSDGLAFPNSALVHLQICSCSSNNTDSLCPWYPNAKTHRLEGDVASASGGIYDRPRVAETGQSSLLSSNAWTTPQPEVWRIQKTGIESLTVQQIVPGILKSPYSTVVILHKYRQPIISFVRTQGVAHQLLVGDLQCKATLGCNGVELVMYQLAHHHQRPRCFQDQLDLAIFTNFHRFFPPDAATLNPQS